MVTAPLRETLAAQLILLSKWDPRTELLVDPMTGGATLPIEAAGLARGVAVRAPSKLPLARLAAFQDLPHEAPPLFGDTVPRILACDRDEALVAAMVGNLRAASLTGRTREKSIVIRVQDARELEPGLVRRLLGVDDEAARGVFVLNPPHGVRLTGPGGAAGLPRLYRELGRALGRFSGWRAAVFTAHPEFLEAFGHAPRVSKPTSNAGLSGAMHVFEL